jgi:hypothetical protein
VTMYFDQTGEFWTLDGGAIVELGKAGPTLNHEGLIKGWREVMVRVFKVFSNYGAVAPYKLVVGISGNKNLRWPGTWSHDRPIARKTGFVHQAVFPDTSDATQLAFLHAAYSKMGDLFGLKPPSLEDVAAVTGVAPPRSGEVA